MSDQTPETVTASRAGLIAVVLALLALFGLTATDLIVDDGDDGDAGPPTTTTVAPTTTTVPPTTTTTAPPTTTTTAAPPSSGTETWFDDFATDTLDNYDLIVTHRNVDLSGFDGFSGGSWTGDHEATPDGCGPPGTQRDLSWQPGDTYESRLQSIYWCPVGTGHVMTSMGDVDGYSWVALTPARDFTDVVQVSWDVNGTDLGTRQFPEVKLIPIDVFDPLNLPCVILSPTPCNTSTYGELGAFGFTEFNDNQTFATPDGSPNVQCNLPADPEADASKAIRRTHVLTDNGDGTVTLEIEGKGVCTVPGSFPDGDVRVVFADHNYTPLKGCPNAECAGFTWHWDNFGVIFEG